MKRRTRIICVLLYFSLLAAVLLYQRGRTSHGMVIFEVEPVSENSIIADGISFEPFQVFYEHALTHIASNNYEEAIEDFYVAYQISQEQPSLLFAFPQFLEDFHQALLNRSLIYLHQGEEELATQDYEMAMTLLPELYSTPNRCWLMRRLRCDEQSSRSIAENKTIPILVPQ